MTIKTKFNIGDTVYYAQGPLFRKGTVETIIARAYKDDSHTDYVVSGNDVAEKDLFDSMESLYEAMQVKLKAALDKSKEMIAKDKVAAKRPKVVYPA